MNDSLSITVDADLSHGMSAKKCAATCNKMRRNGEKRELHIIIVQNVLKFSENAQV